MTREELEKEAGKWLRKYLLCCNCEKKCTCIDSNSYCEEQVLKAYVDSAEPREKEIKSLGERCLQLQKDKGELTDKVKELEQKLVEADNATDCFNRQEEIIAKAKELLKAVVDFYPTTTATILCEAEQFLKE